MRVVAFALFVATPLLAFAQVSPPPSKPHSVRVSVVNMSGAKRQWLTPQGRIVLPVGRRVDVLAEPGCAVRVVSDMESSVQQRVCVDGTTAGGYVVLR